MVVLRSSFRWTSRWVNQTTKSSRSSLRSRVSQYPRRGYASHDSHHGAKKSSNELTWAITSAACTIPALYYLAQPQFKSAHDDGHSHGHGEEGHDHDPEDKGGDVEDSESGDLVPNLHKQNSGDEGAEGDGDSKTEGGDENSDEEAETSGSDQDEGQQSETPDTSDDEAPEDTAHETNSGGNVEGVQFKGATSGGTEDGEQGDTRKHIPDAKGGNKKRIESDYGMKQGIAGEDHGGPDQPDDAPAQSKSPGSMQSSQSGKQEGLSNTDTKHSTDIANDPDKSTKGEGGPETAKLKGTVDPGRPQK